MEQREIRKGTLSYQFYRAQKAIPYLRSLGKDGEILLARAKEDADRIRKEIRAMGMDIVRNAIVDKDLLTNNPTE